jgi:hypothetical protein
MAGAACIICASFSWGERRERRSSTRASLLRDVFWKGKSVVSEEAVKGSIVMMREKTANRCIIRLDKVNLGVESEGEYAVPA